MQVNLLDQPRWKRYARWNRAVAEVLFSKEQEGSPVYLDLEDDVMAAVATAAGEHGVGPAQNLVSAVADTVDNQAPTKRLLRTHDALVQKWERSRQFDPPPHLALLSVLSLAAERMAEGDGMSSSNYYGRLAPLLGMAGRRDDLANAYRLVAERWWGALNKWLENHDGRRGLPTAYSLSEQQQRYVGLPISQALVRAADRDGLVRFFQRVGFAAGSDVAPQALIPLLDAWIGQNPSPATRSLQRMWSKSATKDRIAEVAAVALAAWDGSVRSGLGVEHSQESLRLTATIGGVLRPRLELGVLAYLEYPDDPRELRVTTVGNGLSVTAVPVASGAMRLNGIREADPGSLLDGVLTIEDPRTGRLVTRRPRRLVPMRRHELLQQLIESDQVQAGEDLVLLVDRTLLRSLTVLLDEVARPGWFIADDLQGTPTRWATVRGVQVLRGPSVPPVLDLRALIPLTLTNLVLAGGYALPGRLQRWHSMQPPEIRALDDSGSALCIRLTSLNLDSRDGADSEGETLSAGRQWVSDAPGAMVVDLSTEKLPDGDYRAELYRVTETRPATSLVLRLRSADVPDVLQWEQAPALGHQASDPLGVISAYRLEGLGPWLQGAAIGPGDPGHTAPESSASLPTSPQWSTCAPVSAQRAGWKLATPDPASCMFTGRHYMLVPEDRGGRPTSQFIASTCRDCGIVKRVATTAWAARKRVPGSPSPLAQLDVRSLLAVRREESDRWGIALDALGYLGGGDWGLLEKVALQVEASALFVDQFARTLEMLGHIEVERHGDSLEPIGWEITPTSLIGTPSNRWYLTGYWPSSLVSSLQECVEAAGGGIHHDDRPEGPHCRYVEMSGGAPLPDLSDFGDPVVLPAAYESVLGSLRDLGDVIDALPRRSADLVGEVTMFSPTEARWLPAASLGAPGAYRVRRWVTLDVLRTDHDVSAGTVARSTVHLSKHAAALGAGRLLLAYDPRTRDLSVPLGADLPGLYGRAAALASGVPPIPDVAARRLVYGGVPPSVATALARRLSN